jgi:hypothetical protein
MKRRTLLKFAAASAAAVAALGAGGALWLSGPAAPVFEHCAQSIEFSLHGFPQAKSATFQATAGALGFAAFEAHAGPLAPHFAYGELDKAQYTRAHLMHLANHAERVRQA